MIRRIVRRLLLIGVRAWLWNVRRRQRRLARVTTRLADRAMWLEWMEEYLDAE